MKASIGPDDESRLVHHVECTAANVADVIQVHTRLHGDEATACGDSSHTGLRKREDMAKCRARCLIAAR